MIAALSWLGRLSLPVVTSLVPGLSPRLLMILAGFLAVLVAVGGPAGAVWLHMHGVKREAINLANASCELRIAESVAQSAQILAGILSQIPEDDEDGTAAEICKRDRFCKAGGKK